MQFLIVFMKPFILTIFLFCTINISAQSYLTSGGAKASSMSDAAVTISDVFAAFNNQACLSLLEKPETGLAIQNRFGMKELNTLSAAFALPLSANKGVFALSVNRYGYKLFNQNKIGLAYAKRLSPVFSAGIQADYLNTHIDEGYGNKSSFTIEGGVLAEFNKLKAGIHIFNPLHVKFTDYDDERIPVIIKAGISYSFSEKVLAAVEIFKSINRKETYKIALEYHPFKALYIRGGVSTEPVQLTFGFGLKFSQFYADFTSGYFEPLGYSPGLALRYAF
jgi:hypothetical protein